MLYLENAQTISDIFSSQYMLLIVTFAIINMLFALPVSRKYMQILQQSGYVKSEYLRWMARRDNVYLSRLAMVTMLSMLSYFIFAIAFAFVENEIIMYLGFVFYVLFMIVYIRSDFKRREKAPLVVTKRVVRLYISFSLIYFLFTFGLLLLSNVLGFYSKNNGVFLRVRFIVLCVTPILVPFSVLLAALINSPMERLNNKKYVDKCKKTLDSHGDLIKIGITGSYGKTSVKEILKTMLSEKYKVLSTPASYNTPMGICKTVKKLNSTYDVFIAEMGARHEGDIKELCDIVKPTHAIVNGIIEHHMETFSSLSKIIKTKAELIESVEKGGSVILTGDNENTRSLAERYKNLNVCLAGIDPDVKQGVYAGDIKISGAGTEFTLNVFGEEEKAFTTLLGKHNVSNICLAAAMCAKLGLSLAEILAGIARIRPIKHRLEISYNDLGMTVIDDSYNSNVAGTRAAIEVLSCFKGRKIIVTPGIVEMGRAQDLANYELGERLAEAVDIAVLVGSVNSYKIRDGLINKGFSLENVYISKDLEDAKSYLKKHSLAGDVVLFENDLPDKFS